MIWTVAALLALLASAPQNGLQEALKALEAEDYAQAAQLLESVVEEDPEDFQARFNLAFAYTQLGENDKAIVHYEKAIEQKPDLLPARQNLGMILLRVNRAAHAVPQLEAVAAERGNEFGAQFYYAHALLKSGRAADAIPFYRKALALDAASAEGHLELGQALAHLERYDEAAASYRQAARLDPNLEQMLLQLAERLERAKRTEVALSLYQEYLASHADAAAVQERVGMLLMELKRCGEAIDVLKAVAAQNPTAANQAALAEAYVLSDQPAQALPAWRAAVEAEPDSVELRLRYAAGLLHQQGYGEAGQQYLEAVKRDPSRVEAWNGLGFCLYKAENYQGALKALSEAAARGTIKPANVYLRAIIEDKLQMYPEAKASYEKFLAMNPGLEDEEWKSRQRLKVINRVLQKHR